MQIYRLVNAGNWPLLFGMVFFNGMMAVGYYYNLTFVQFSLLDLGARLIGMSERQVAIDRRFWR